MQETSAGAVIYRRARGRVLFLLLLYEGGHWDFVKGHVEAGEREEETLARETREETGISDLVLVPGFREQIHYFYTRDGKKMSKDVAYFLAETKSAIVELSHEHDDFVWLALDDALAKVTYENSKNVLKKADTFIKKLVKS
jgi:bis(5'-nucleosidyl)-tetraphosphatase